MKGMCSLVQEFNLNHKMQSKLVFSLFRDNALATKHYSWIRNFIRTHPDLGKEISGIDFAFAEEGFPPSSKKEFFKKFHEDNKLEQKLDLLYHVGESFEDKSQISAIRWVYEAHQMRATRVGHAIALGVDPENYRSKKVSESREEFLKTQDWLSENYDLLKSHGLSLSKSDILKRKSKAEQSLFIEFSYNDESIAEIRDVQQAVAKILREQKVLIESCPSSNLLIGQVRKPEHHPLRLFHKLGLDYVVATDDPGIFDTSPIKEAALAHQIIRDR